MNNTKNLPKALPRGIEKACAGIVESVLTHPYVDFIEQASLCVGENYASDFRSENERQRLVEAIKLNMIDRKEYPFSLLQRRYQLPITIRVFLAEKRRFSTELASLCGFLPKTADPFPPYAKSSWSNDL